MQKNRFLLQKRWMNLVTICGVLLTALFVLYGIHEGIFRSRESLEAFLEPMGPGAPTVFVLIQAIQVVVPILPGAVGCVAGVLVFGPIWGFVYNYVGICIGSLAAFLLAKQYGRPLVIGVTSQKTYDKYVGWLDRGARFDLWFALAIFFPVAPDDFLCMLAGLTKMSVRKFMAIILLGKPFSIAIYSMGLTAVLQQIFRLVSGL